MLDLGELGICSAYIYILNTNHIKETTIWISSDLRIYKVPAFDLAAYNYSDNYEMEICKYWKNEHFLTSTFFFYLFLFFYKYFL